MGFLAPGALTLGAGLIALLVLLYLLRPRRPARAVSSTLLWLAALNDAHAQQPWRRIPPRILLIVQLATLVALSAALARPYVLQTNAPGPFSIVLLDASASMQATDVAPSRFEAARQRVRSFVESLGRGDTVALISLDAAPRVLSPPSDDHGAFGRALDAVQPTSAAAQLRPALALAETLASGHPDAQITIVGDGSLDRDHDVPPGYPLPIRWLGVGSADPLNLAVTGLTTRQTNGRLSALTRVVNPTARQVAASLTLRVDGARFDTRTLTIAPSSSTDAEWTELPPAVHTLEARLGGSDALALDDAAFAVLDTDRPTRVALISEGNAFLERALALRANATVTVLRPGDALPNDGKAIDLVVCDGVVPPPLPSGAALWLIHPPLASTLLAVGPDIEVTGFAAVQPPSALSDDLALGGVHINRSRRLQTPGWADAVLSAPETPLLLMGNTGGRRVAVLGFDVHESDLPLQPAFPVLVQRVFDRLVPSATAAAAPGSIGEPVALAPLPSSVSLEIVDPAGRSTTLTLPSTTSTFSATDTPGLYTVTERDGTGVETHSAFAINFADSRQSQLLPAGDVSPTLTGTMPQPVQAPHEVWQVLAALAMAGLALELALDWWHFLTPTSRARLALGLRAMGAIALVAALLGASIPRVASRQAIVFVVDTSSSMDAVQADLAAYLREAVTQRGPDDVYAVVSTARDASVSQPIGQGPLDTSRLLQPHADGTDLAAGLRLAADVLPAGYRPRIVVLSDGQETQGSAASTARALSARGVQVDTVPLGGSATPEVLVESVTAPSHVRQGERFDIGVRLVSNVVTDGTLHVSVNGQALADAPVALASTRTDLNFTSVADRSGLVSVSATVEPRLDTIAANNTVHAVVSVDGPPRVLVVQGRPDEGSVMVSALQSTGVAVDSGSVDAVPDTLGALGAYSSVVLADVSATALSRTQLDVLRSFVRDLGHGLVAVGGDTSFGQGEYVDTPLDEILPVRSSVRAHRDAGRTAMVLVLDKSGSMGDDVGGEGTTKLQMARQATVLAAQQLGPRDAVGLLAFDSQPHWLLPLTSLLGLGPTALDDRLADLSADGGTDVFPALTAAVDGAAAMEARYKHVILLTDGQSCCGGNYAGLLDRMRQANITLSTIGIGADADGQLLANLARQGDGRYYFTEHARDIPRLMTRETELATRGPLVEGSLTPHQVAFDRSLSDLGSAGFPTLTGYLVTTPKDTAQVLLATESGDPILARWQAGLGRTVAWTSDLRGRWSDDWLSWPAMPRFLSDLVSWTLPGDSGPIRLAVRNDPSGGTAHVTVNDAEIGTGPLTVTARLAQPNGTGTDAHLAPTAPGRYERTFPLDGPGVYAVRVNAQRDGAPVGSAEAGLPVSYSPELRSVGIDDARMDAIAAAGDGHRLIGPSSAFADDLAPVTTSLPLRDVLLLLAAVLLPLDIAVRRLRLSPRDIWDWWRRPRALQLDLPWSAAPHGVPAAPWSPGVWLAERRTPAPVIRSTTTPTLGGPATPGLARQTSQAPERDQPTPAADAHDEQDALSETLRWLAARRGKSSGDRG